MSQIRLIDLSTELLVLVFSFLDVKTLGRLRMTCKRFNKIINLWDRTLLGNISPLVTNQNDSRMFIRSTTTISLFEKLRLEDNWKRGRYKVRKFIFSKRKYMPWLQLNSDYLWFSRGKFVTSHYRIDSSTNFSKYYHKFYGQNEVDVVRFKVKHDNVLMGKRDGGMSLWSIAKKRLIFDFNDVHACDVTCVDIAKNGTIFFSGSRDYCLKIWRKDDSTSEQLINERIEMLPERIWCGAFSEDESLVAVGTAAIEDLGAIRIYDSERLSGISTFSGNKRGEGVLDLKWDGSNCILSCSYDAHVRKWDLRTGTCVNAYINPYDVGLYCLETDYCNTIIGGSQRDGRITLWDMRYPKCVQIFFAETKSPIYSLSFDIKNIYAATDQNVVVLDFSIYNAPVQDYSSIV